MIGQVYAETEWELVRLGKMTSSQISVLFTEPKDVITDKQLESLNELESKPKLTDNQRETLAKLREKKAAKERGDLSEGAKTYIEEKVSELFTGTTRQLSTWATDWGNQYEPEAIEALKDTFPDIEHYGNNNRLFLPYTELSGGSPDATIHKAVFEVKCPEKPNFHMDNLLLETSDQFKDAHNDYWHQLQMNAICVAKYQGISIFDMKAYFVSYGPYMLDKYEALKLHVLEVDIDYTFAARLDKRLEKAEKYMRQYVQRFLAKIKR